MFHLEPTLFSLNKKKIRGSIDSFFLSKSIQITIYLPNYRLLEKITEQHSVFQLLTN